MAIISSAVFLSSVLLRTCPLQLSAVQSMSMLLEDLQPGLPISGHVLCRHKNKLVLETAVKRRGKHGELKPVIAYLSLPPARASADDGYSKLIGRQMQVFVHSTQVAAGRLRCSLTKPAAAGPSPRERLLAAHDSDTPQRLEDLDVGDTLLGTILSVHKFGAFVGCGVCRAARRGQLKPVAAILPADQLRPGLVLANLKVGQQLEARVLRASPHEGRLQLTTRAVDASAIKRRDAVRRERRRRAGRRPSLAALAAKVGTEREGIVISLRPYGVLVNVGATRPGLIHVSQLDPGAGPKGGGRFVADPSDVCTVGDKVVVKILPRSSEAQLRLRMVRVFPRDEEEASGLLTATLRRGERLTPKYVRAEDDDVEQGSAQEAEEDTARQEAEMEAAWAAAEATQVQAQAGTEEEAWTQYEQAFGSAAAASDDGDDADDPWAWAAAGAATEASAELNEEAEAEKREFDEPDFGGDDYFEEKYDIDYY